MELGEKTLIMSDSTQIFGDAKEVLTEENLSAVYGLTVSLEKGKYRNYAAFEDTQGIHRLVY